MIKLSFIVPVYNVELYLEKCIQSLLDQDIPYSEYEIIVINDGSTDHSGEIIDRLSVSYPIIKKIHQENKGLSEARNAGLTVASGKYIWFIDSDDYILPNCLKEMVSLYEEKNLEIVDMRYTLVNESGDNIQAKRYMPLFPFNQTVDGSEYLNNYIFESGVCRYSFSHEFLKRNNLRFISGIYHEDEEFTARAVFFAKRIIVLNKITYFYLQRNHSIIRATDKKVIDKKNKDFLSVIYSLSTFATQQEGNVEPSLINGLRRRIGMLTIGMLFKLFTTCDSSDLFVKYIQDMKSKGVYPIKYTPKGIKYKIFTPCINCYFLLLTFMRLRNARLARKSS
jgi:glycosyltransferase involved in cell wall biosynthesis